MSNLLEQVIFSEIDKRGCELIEKVFDMDFFTGDIRERESYIWDTIGQNDKRTDLTNLLNESNKIFLILGLKMGIRIISKLDEK